MSCHHVSSSCIYFHSNEPKWIANDFESSTPHITKSWFQTFNLADGLLILHKAQLTLCQQTIPLFDSEWGRKVDTELQNHQKRPLGMNYITYWWIYNSRFIFLFLGNMGNIFERHWHSWCCPKHWTRFTFDNTCGMSWKSHSRPKHKSLPMVPSASSEGQRWQRSQKNPPNCIGIGMACLWKLEE